MSSSKPQAPCARLAITIGMFFGDVRLVRQRLWMSRMPSTASRVSLEQSCNMLITSVNIVLLVVSLSFKIDSRFLFLIARLFLNEHARQVTDEASERWHGCSSGSTSLREYEQSRRGRWRPFASRVKRSDQNRGPSDRVDRVPLQTSIEPESISRRRMARLLTNGPQVRMLSPFSTSQQASPPVRRCRQYQTSLPLKLAPRFARV